MSGPTFPAGTIVRVATRIVRRRGIPSSGRWRAQLRAAWRGRWLDAGTVRTPQATQELAIERAIELALTRGYIVDSMPLAWSDFFLTECVSAL